MDRKTKEAIRYLGYGKNAVDADTKRLISDSFRELDQAAEQRMVYRIFELQEADGQITIGSLLIESKALEKNMKGCEKALMLGATLGAEVDRLLRKYELTDMARAVVLQACAAAMLEEYLDTRQEELKEDLGREGWYLRPRFSPGYGDFDIRHQKLVLRMLESEKKIGLMATDSCMLIPTKSVTAVIGLSKTPISCHRQGCEACDKADCTYRRATS